MSLTRPLTRPLTRKISRAEITQGYGGSFSPLLLNPYLLFDARESMVGTLENPTLDLNPALPETLDVITATRSGTATYTDANGNIATAAADTVRVDYTQGEELTPTKFQRVGYTDFSSGWYTSNVTISTNQDTAPDGTQTAAKYVGSGTAQDSYYNDTFTGPFTYSLFVKYINAPFIRLRNGNTSTWFDLTTVSVATKNHDSAAIKDVGDGWFRISVTVNSSSSFIRAYFYPHSTDNTTVEQDGGSFYLWGPQLEEGTTASDFVANTTGSPKFITGATYGPRVPMILVEPSATNLVEYSEDFSNSYWPKAGVTVLASSEVDPSGGTNAYELIESATTSNHLLNLTYITGVTSLPHTYSVYAKANTRSWIRIQGQLPTNSWANFNLSTGEFGSSGLNQDSFSFESVGDGWYRVSVTNTPSSQNSGIQIFVLDSDLGGPSPSYTGDGTSGLYLWGAQVEAGSLTSYIPTSGSTVTRAADDLEISGSDFTDAFYGTEGTFFVTANLKDPVRGYGLITGGSTNQLFIYSNSNTSNIYSYDGSTAGKIGIGSSNQDTNIAVSWDSSEFTSAKDGVIDPDATQTHNGNFSLATRINIGSGYGTMCGHIKRVLFWPYSSDRL
jgi:hypothetical protein